MYEIVLFVRCVTMGNRPLNQVFSVQADGFVDVVSAVIKDSTGRHLYMYHEGRQMWLNPGGKVELGEDFEAALVREIKEEIGLDARDVRLLGVRKTVKCGLWNIYYYSVTVLGEPVLQETLQFVSLRWLAGMAMDNVLGRGCMDDHGVRWEDAEELLDQHLSLWTLYSGLLDVADVSAALDMVPAAEIDPSLRYIQYYDVTEKTYVMKLYDGQILFDDTVIPVCLLYGKDCQIWNQSPVRLSYTGEP